MTEMPEAEKELIKSQILDERKKTLREEIEAVTTEYEKEKAVLARYKKLNLPSEEIKEQEKLVKSLYDQKRRMTTTKKLEVPNSIYELLEIDECSVLQKKWLLYYALNGGNAVDACSKANVTLRQYHTWKKNFDDETCVAFRYAIEDIDQAYTDIAEMNLKEMAASKNSAALIFFLKNKHEAYKPTAKAVKDDNKKRKKGISSYKKVSPKKKQEVFKVMMGEIKEDYKGEDEIVE
jgi:hypothetical protein